MEKIELKRVFVLKKNGKEIKLEDPDPAMAPVKVATFYSNIHPELVNASVTGPKYNDNGEAVYTMSATVGTKG